MESSLGLHRLHFAFTATYHYLFPQLTMGLALLIVVLKTQAIRAGGRGNGIDYDVAARFWARIFGIAFALGVVTGIPMEFQFGTNWGRFSSVAGGVIGQTLAMEGVFSFFLESSFLGLFLFGEKRLSRWAHWGAAFAVFFGSWLSGYFIIATDAWMQHPVGYITGPDGRLELSSFWALLLNEWAFWQYWHNMMGSVVTASFSMAAVGAFYLLHGKHRTQSRIYIRTGVLAALTASLLLAFPTGDYQGKNVAKYQPATLAAIEGLFRTQSAAPITIMGQPDPARGRIDNPIEVPGVLSFLTYKRWAAEVRGLEAFQKENWPDNIPLLFYSFHIMIGLGTIFIAIAGIATFLLMRGRLFRARWMMWILMLILPLPYIANTAGWMTAELGRQPWLIYGLMRTSEGASLQVSPGNVLFSLIGFMGIYAVLSILALFLFYREIERGPAGPESPALPHHPAEAEA